MKLRVLVLFAVCLAAAAVAWPKLRLSRAEPGVKVLKVANGPISVISTYEGTVGSEQSWPVLSKLSGSATIVEIAPDGTELRAGDLAVRFDASRLQRDVAKLELELAAAKAEMAGLGDATLPLARAALERKVADARAAAGDEVRALAETEQLLRENLIPPQELERQRTRAESAKATLAGAEQELNLTVNKLHPSLLAKALTAVAAAEQELKDGREQMEKCEVRAPSGGVMVLQPVYFGAEYRSVRVGDGVQQNQIFAAVADLSRPSVKCIVPESEWPDVTIGQEVAVVPHAYTDLALRGKVIRVAPTAQSLPWRPAWQKSFEADVEIERPDSRLRLGMSVHVQAYTYRNPNALLISRAAVYWRDNRPFCMAAGRGKTAGERELRLGRADGTNYEVLGGLGAGEQVVLP